MHFDFKEIFTNEALVIGNTGFDFETPYVLGGTFNMNDFPLRSYDAQPLHINVWARDPFPVDVPEPASLSIFAKGAVALTYRNRQRLDLQK